LSHDEIVYRRLIKSEKTQQEQLLSGGSLNTTLPKTKGKHDKDSDRPPSNMRGRESNKEKPDKVLTKKEKIEQVLANSTIAPNRDRSKSKVKFEKNKNLKIILKNLLNAIQDITRDSSAEKIEKLNTLKIKRDSNSSMSDMKAKEGKRGTFISNFKSFSQKEALKLPFLLQFFLYYKFDANI
jgi:hypothetical protein